MLDRLRAARLDEFIPVLQELHREFKWPYPAHPSNPSPQPHLLLPGSAHHHQPHPSQQISEHFSPNSTLQDSLSPPKTTPTDHMTPRAATPVEAYTNDDSGNVSADKSKNENFADESTSSLKRANRPPDLDLSPGRSATSIPVELANQKLVSVAAVASLRGQSSSGAIGGGGQGDFDPTRSSTPTKHSGSISERVSLVYKKNACKNNNHYICSFVTAYLVITKVFLINNIIS